MYKNKLTKDEKNERFGRLVAQKQALIAGTDRKSPGSKEMIQAYFAFIALSPIEQKRQYGQWHAYYKKVREESISYQMFHEQKKAMSQLNLSRVIALGKEARLMGENNDTNFIPKPKYIDPYEFEYGAIMHAYFNCERLIKEFIQSGSEEDKEAKGIWE